MTTSKKFKTEVKQWNSLGRKEKSNTSETNDRKRGNKSQGTSEKRKTKHISK